MQYEKVILEMLERIQALEDQVKELKEKQKSVLPQPAPTLIRQEVLTPPMPRRTNTKVTDEMLEACYWAGKRAVGSDYADVTMLADQVSMQTGMNRNNAIMTIFAVVALLNGELYKRAVSGRALARYFDNILCDYGKGGLQRAIAATRKHIDYRRALHHNVDLLEQICDRYQKMI